MEQVEQVFTIVGSFFSMIPFSAATWFVLLNMAFFVWLFAKADQRSDNPVHWEHLVIDSQNNRASPYKVGYLIGVIVSTWIVIKISDAGNLSLDIFGAYLACLVTGAGVNSYAKVKQYGSSPEPTHTRPDVDYLQQQEHPVDQPPR